MSPFIFLGVLAASSLAALLPWSDKALRNASIVMMAVSSGLAMYFAWPGFFVEAQTLGPGSMWYLDSLAALMVWLIAILALSATIISHQYLAHEKLQGLISVNDVRFYYATLPLFVAAMYVTALSNNVGLMWVALEATTLSTTLLVAFYRKRSAIEAAWKYVILCSFGISLGLVGVLLLTHAVGQNGENASMLLTTFKTVAADGGANLALSKWAFVFLFVGIGTKVGFVPMHTWLPDAHSKTPTPISALLSGILLNVALVSLLRFRQVIDIILGDGGTWTGWFFLVFGLVSIVVSALMLIVQKNYKRLLAFSSIEHMGLMAFAVGLGPAGIIPAVMHMPVHALLKSSLFFGAGEILTHYRTTDATKITDIWRRFPKTGQMFLWSLLLLLAVPPSGAFVSEMIMIGFGLREWLWPTLLVVVALTVVFVAMLKLVYGMLFGDRPTDEAETVVTEERWQIQHGVIGLHLLAAMALGIFYLTPQGLEFMVGIAKSLSVGLL